MQIKHMNNIELGADSRTVAARTRVSSGLGKLEGASKQEAGISYGEVHGAAVRNLNTKKALIED